MADFPGIDAALEPLNLPPGVRHLIVGYSGGVDSHVLLHRLAMQRQSQSSWTLAACYVDHGLQATSRVWGEHCAEVCRALDVPLRRLTVDARSAVGESPEAAARHARYAALAAGLTADTALLTAHHCDDQAETLLLQLLRGAGAHGLAAMPSRRRLGYGWLLRPLLEVERAELLAYAGQYGLRWIEDASNTDTRFDRNYLRHQVFPLLQERWSRVHRSLARSARLCAETAAWIDEQAAADLVQVATDRPNCLSIPALRTLPELRQRHVLRYWLRQCHLPMPSVRQLQQMLHDTLTAALDRNPCMRWPGVEIRRYRDGLYAMPPLTPHDAQQQFIWQTDGAGESALDLPGIGQLRIEKTLGSGLCAETLATGRFIVRFRQGGERFQPVGRHHRQELKKLLQQAGIPPWERERLPLVYLPNQQGECGELLAVIGLAVAANRAANNHEPGWQPRLIPASGHGLTEFLPLGAGLDRDARPDRPAQ